MRVLNPFGTVSSTFELAQRLQSLSEQLGFCETEELKKLAREMHFLLRDKNYPAVEVRSLQYTALAREILAVTEADKDAANLARIGHLLAQARICLVGEDLNLFIVHMDDATTIAEQEGYKELLDQLLTL